MMSSTMRISSVLSLLTLATSVVARVPSLVDSYAVVDSRALPRPGCANFYGDDQHIKLYSGGMAFEMWVPTDGNTYNIECWDRMDYVEILTPGFCSFALTDDYKKIISMDSDHTNGKNPFPVAAYLALVSCHKSNVMAVRDIGNAELSCVETFGLNITLWTGSSEYILPIPANETVFDVIGPDARLGCIGPLGQKYAMCEACNFPVQTLTLSVAAGTCAFNFSGYADLIYHNYRFGPLSLPSPTQIWSVECGIGHRNDPPAVEARSTQINRESDSHTLYPIDDEQCHDGIFDDYEVVWLWGTTPSNHTKYQLNVYPYGQWYKLSGDTPDLGCAEALVNNVVVHGSPFSCYQCDMVVDKIRFDSQRGGACRFRLDGWNELVEVEAVSDDRLAWNLTTPKRILEVECQVEGSKKASDAAVRSLQTDTVDDGQTDTDSYLDSLAVWARGDNLGLRDNQCPQSGYKVAIQTADGNTYFAPVPLDYKFHPMAEIFCVRLVDAACVSCSEIGTAGNVSTEVQWGPCIFVTEDHRQFFTQYWNALPDGSKMIPLTPINPGDAIAGIECGSGA